jgi:hypothetical protein
LKKNMGFKEKIDKILKHNQLGINSVSGLEDFVTAGRGAINDFYNEDREPGRKTLKKIKSLPGLNEDWYENGTGSVFLTSVPDEPPLNKKDPEEENRILIRNLDRIGATNEYLLQRVRELEQRLGMG